MTRTYKVITTLLALFGIGLLWSLQKLGLYSHQAFALVIMFGLFWAVGSRIFLVWKKKLHLAFWRAPKDRKHRTAWFQVVGRGLFWFVLTAACLLVFPRTEETIPYLFAIGVVGAFRLLAVPLVPQKLNHGPTVAMMIGALFLCFDLGLAFWPMPPPTLTMAPAFEGEWIVLQGGRSPMQSHHKTAYNQHFALDLVKLEDGKIFREGKEGNAMASSWEAPLFSPVKGKVVVARDDMEDSEGVNFVDDPKDAAGNCIVIETQEGLFVVFAHMRHKTVRVKEGDHVEIGQPLGKVGNSGNTTMSHIHLQVQTHKDLWDPDNRSVPFAFSPAGKVLSRNDIIQGK